MVILIRADLMVLMRLYRKYYIISHQKTQYDYKGMQSTRLAIHKMCFFNALPLNLVCHGFPQRVGGTLIIPLTVARNKWIWASSKATQTFHLALLSPDVSFIWNDWKDAGKTAHRSLCLIPPFELLLSFGTLCTHRHCCLWRLQRTVFSVPQNEQTVILAFSLFNHYLLFTGAPTRMFALTMRSQTAPSEPFVSVLISSSVKSHSESTPGAISTPWLQC